MYCVRVSLLTVKIFNTLEEGVAVYLWKTVLDGGTSKDMRQKGRRILLYCDW